MELRKEAQHIDVTGMGTLLGVVAASMVVLGVIIYVFGDDQSSSVSAAYSVPTMTERMKRNRSMEPRTVGSITPIVQTTQQ